jgi:hypothetical protein
MLCAEYKPILVCVMFPRLVWLILDAYKCNFHTQCDFDTHKCDGDTHDCDINTHKSDFYTQSVILTRLSVIMTHTCKDHTLRVEITLVCDVHTHTVINTRTSVITRKMHFELKTNCTANVKTLFWIQKCKSIFFP